MGKSDSDRFAILTRVEALTKEEALAAMIDRARKLGHTPIRASCRPTHLPNIWEGAVEVEEPTQCSVLERLNRDFKPSPG